MTSTAPFPPPSAVEPARRALGPDLARGAMLLGIAVVHATLLREMALGGRAEPVSGGLDAVSRAAVTVLFEARSYPLFALLFGYGLASIHQRRAAEGRPWTWTRSLVRRRGRWLLVLGVAHTVLLFFGDILGVYGLIAVLFAGLLQASDRRILAHALAWSAGGSLAYVLLIKLVVPADPSGSSVFTDSPLVDAGLRLVTWPVMLPVTLLSTVFPVLFGVWAARRGLLERPEEHLPLLRRTAAGGIAVGVLGGLPAGLGAAGVVDPGALGEAVTWWVHVLTGYAGGFGYAALLGLVAARAARRRPGRLVRALVATWQRSLTCYLLQSVAWAVLFPHYALDIAPRISVAGGVAVGAGVWLLTVVAAAVMERNGVRGPAERFLRWRTYSPARGKAAADGPAPSSPVARR